VSLCCARVPAYRPTGVQPNSVQSYGRLGSLRYRFALHEARLRLCLPLITQEFACLLISSSRQLNPVPDIKVGRIQDQRIASLETGLANMLAIAGSVLVVGSQALCVRAALLRILPPWLRHNRVKQALADIGVMMQGTLPTVDLSYTFGVFRVPVIKAQNWHRIWTVENRL